MPAVWLQSRLPGKSARFPNRWVQRTGVYGFADITHQGRRFVFSHDIVVRSEAGNQESWLVFTDAGPAPPSSLRDAGSSNA